jgi:DNA-directed RNA polymerase subunit RPC12/RpoP
MTNNIVNMEDYRQHQTSYVACLDCGKDWIAVAPANTMHFECPACEKLSAEVVDPSSADFINTFMRPAKTKAARLKRTMVVINAQRMIDAGEFNR